MSGRIDFSGIERQLGEIGRKLDSHSKISMNDKGMKKILKRKTNSLKNKYL